MDFYITTPIYYINGAPHIGHAYTSIAADVMARFKRLDGFNVKFVTGTDEHGLKVARSAELSGKNIHEFCDDASECFRKMTKALNISNDDFIRTTEERHIKSAQSFWKRIEHDIYKDTYSGWYSTRDEEYVLREDIVDGKAPSGAPVEWMEEESYFFKLSSYQDKLLELYEKNPDFIAPEAKRNEVISFVKSGLKDLSISRSKFNWGIPIPGLKNQVMYVWIDALTNYITVLDFPENEDVSHMMSNCVHIVGKEILRFHAVYWPAFLMSAGISLPKKVFGHGWWTSEGEKMSKSLGNVVDPFELIKNFGLDAVRYFLLREVRFGEDGDFSREALKRRFNYDLANDFGNLIQRVLAFIYKIGGEVNFCYDFNEKDEALFKSARHLIDGMRPSIDSQDLYSALDKVMRLVADSNKYVSEMKPWELQKANSPRLDAVLTALCESIRAIAFGISPFMPDTAKQIFSFIGTKGESFNEIDKNFSTEKILAPSPLFPREK